MGAPRWTLLGALLVPLLVMGVLVVLLGHPGPQERRLSPAQLLPDTSTSCTRSYGLTSPCISWVGKLRPRGQEGRIEGPTAQMCNAAEVWPSLQSPSRPGAHQAHLVM